MLVTSNTPFRTRSARRVAPTEELDNPRGLREEPLRPWLRHAARSATGAPVSVAETPWDHVVSGRWAPIDSFEYEATLYVIAQKNTAETQSRNALTPREQAVLAAAAEGVPNKCIAYDQGISQGSVSLTLARMRERLNVRTAAELVRALWVLKPRECQQTTTGTGYWLTDGREYVSFSRAPVDAASIAGLTRGERMVFQAVISGFSTAAIAAMRGSSERTLANQLASIFRKLNVGSRAQMRACYAHCYRERDVEESFETLRLCAAPVWRPARELVGRRRAD
jgi:DNA-binding NarL/FixJ family response regulator